MKSKLFLAVFINFVAALKFSLPSRGNQCLVIDSEKNQNILILYEAAHEENDKVALDLSYELLDDNNQVIGPKKTINNYSATHYKELTVNADVKYKTAFHLCFTNSAWKEIDVILHTEHSGSNDSFAGVLHLENLAKSLKGLRNSLQNLLQQQSLSTTRELSHTEAVMNAHKHLTHLKTFQLLYIFIASAYQVYHIESMLSLTKRLL